MAPDANQARPLIDRAVLRERVETFLKTTASDEALEAVIHSLECVLGQHLRAAWNGLRDEVADLILRGEFEDIPVLEPRHFLPVVPSDD